MKGGAFQLHGLLGADAARRADAPQHDLLSCAGMTAAVSLWPDSLDGHSAAPDVMEQRLRDHHHILLAYCGQTGVLPLRFATVFSSVPALTDTLLSRQEVPLSAYREIADLREYVLQLSVAAPPAEAATPPGTGRGFLMSRRQQRDDRQNRAQRARALAQSVETRVATIAARPPRSARPQAGRLLDLSFLIAARDVDRLAALAQEESAAAQAPGLDLLLTGPWPAYSYTFPALQDHEVLHGA